MLGPFIAVGFTIILGDADISILYVTEKYIGCFDVWTNFWCVILSYHVFNDLYHKLCGCLHSKCQSLWIKCVGKPVAITNDESMIGQDLSTNNSNQSNVSTPGLTVTRTNSLPTNTPGFSAASSIDSETVTPNHGVKDIPVYLPQTTGNLQLQMVPSISDGASYDTPTVETQTV